LAPLDRLAQAARVPPAGRGRELAGAIGGQHGGLRALGDADEVAEGERGQLEREVEDLGTRAAALAPRGLLELARERRSLAPLGLELEPVGGGTLDGLLRLLAASLRAGEQRSPRLSLARIALGAREGGSHEALHLGAQLAPVVGG